MKKLLFIIITTLFVISGCTNSYINFNPQEFKGLIEEENTFVLDVHIPEQEHIEGTDELIPFDEIRENIDKLPKDKNTKIAVYCRSGSMSEEASQTLIDLGYKNVYNLVGGRNSYINEFGN